MRGTVWFVGFVLGCGSLAYVFDHANLDVKIAAVLAEAAGILIGGAIYSESR